MLRLRVRTSVTIRSGVDGAGGKLEAEATLGLESFFYSQVDEGRGLSISSSRLVARPRVLCLLF